MNALKEKLVEKILDENELNELLEKLGIDCDYLWEIAKEKLGKLDEEKILALL